MVPLAAPPPLALHDVVGHLGRPDRQRTAPVEEGVEVLEARLGFDQAALARRLVVRAEVRGQLVVAHAIRAPEDRLARGHAPLAFLEEAPGLRELVGLRALADRAAVHVVFAPPERAPGLSVERAHQRLLSVRAGIAAITP